MNGFLKYRIPFAVLILRGWGDNNLMKILNEVRLVREKVLVHILHSLSLEKEK